LGGEEVNGLVARPALHGSNCGGLRAFSREPTSVMHTNDAPQAMVHVEAQERNTLSGASRKPCGGVIGPLRGHIVAAGPFKPPRPQPECGVSWVELERLLIISLRRLQIACRERHLACGKPSEAELRTETQPLLGLSPCLL